MMETIGFAVLALVVITLLLQVVLVLRKPKFDTPADLSVRLALMEQLLQSLSQASARNEAGIERNEVQLREFTTSTVRLLDEKLSLVQDDARAGRGELTGAFTALESRLEQRLGGFDVSMSSRFDNLQQGLQGRLDESAKVQTAQFGQSQAESAQGRKELADTLVTFRNDLTSTLKSLSAETQASREALAQSSQAFEKQIQERFDALAQATTQTLDGLKKDIVSQLGVMSTALKDQLDGNGNQIRNQFTTLQDAVAQQLQGMAMGSQQNSEQLSSLSKPAVVALSCR